MKRIFRQLFLLYIFCFSSTSIFSQIRWDSVPGKFQNANAANLMYADSNYMYVAGNYNEIGGKHMQGIARWNGTKWDSLGAGIDGLQYDSLPSQTPNNTWGIVPYQGKLCVGGTFQSLGHVLAPCIGLWDGTKWSPMPVQPFTATDGFVHALAVINNKLYVAGGFDSLAGQGGILAIACWDGTKWTGLGFPNYGHLFTAIGAICEYNGSIYAGGTFYDSVATDSTAHILRYDGSQWHAVGGGIKGLADGIFTMTVYNGELYVAGLFAKSDGNADNNIQRWDGSRWHDVGGGADYEVFNLQVYHGKLYAMGQLTQISGISASKIACWDGSKWCSLGSRFDNSIGAACVYKDSLYIGGGFWTINGDSISYLAEWTGGNYTENCSLAGVSEMKNETEKVQVYPNPSSGVFTLVIASEAKQSPITIEVYNILGEKVYQSNINSDKSEINLSNQPNGVYLYRVTALTGELVGEGKLIIQK